METIMKETFLRKISIVGRDKGNEFASICLPKRIFALWKEKGCKYVQIEYDEDNDQCIISKI